MRESRGNPRRSPSAPCDTRADRALRGASFAPCRPDPFVLHGRRAIGAVLAGAAMPANFLEAQELRPACRLRSDMKRRVRILLGACAAIAGSAVVASVTRCSRDDRWSMARVQLQQIASSIALYRGDTGHFPVSLDMLLRACVRTGPGSGHTCERVPCSIRGDARSSTGWIPTAAASSSSRRDATGVSAGAGRMRTSSAACAIRSRGNRCRRSPSRCRRGCPFPAGASTCGPAWSRSGRCRGAGIPRRRRCARRGSGHRPRR